MKKMFVKKGSILRERTYHYDLRHLTPNLTGWNLPSTIRLLHRGHVLRETRELAHRHIIESGPMTLTVGSILEGREQLRRERSHG